MGDKLLVELLYSTKLGFFQVLDYPKHPHRCPRQVYSFFSVLHSV